MKKNFVMILVALVVGFFLGNYFLKQYDGLSTIAVVGKNNLMYFFEYGEFNSLEEMEIKTIDLENYIYKEDDGKFYVYVGITKSALNVEKIKSFFERKEYEIVVKNFTVSSSYFNDIIDNYDAIISSTNDDMVISSVLSQGLEKYEEVIIDSGSD